jgi:hypothetical protein
MAVDYKTGKLPTPPTVTEKVETVSSVVDQSNALLQSFDVMPDPRPSEIDVFLALLTAQTTFAGGNKYWANAKNVTVNVARLKVLAKQIVEAY